MLRQSVYKKILKPRTIEAKLFLHRLDVINEELKEGATKASIAKKLGMKPSRMRDLFKTYCRPGYENLLNQRIEKAIGEETKRKL